MKGTNRSLDFLRGHEEINKNAHRTKGACPECQRVIKDFLEEEESEAGKE